MRSCGITRNLACLRTEWRENVLALLKEDPPEVVVATGLEGLGWFGAAKSFPRRNQGRSLLEACFASTEDFRAVG